MFLCIRACFHFFFKCNFKHIPLTSDNVSNVLYNEAHFYCSSSESSERELCGKPGKTHSHSCCGTIDPDLCPDRLTRNQESKPSSNYKIARAIILFLFLTKRITAEVQVTVYCLWYLAFQKETIPLFITNNSLNKQCLIKLKMCYRCISWGSRNAFKA